MASCQAALTGEVCKMIGAHQFIKSSRFQPRIWRRKNTTVKFARCSAGNAGNAPSHRHVAAEAPPGKAKQCPRNGAEGRASTRVFGFGLRAHYSHHSGSMLEARVLFFSFGT